MKNKYVKTRYQLGLTRKQIADKLGISPQLWGMYEKGIRSPKPQFFKKFEDVFGINLQDENVYLENINEDEKVLGYYQQKALISTLADSLAKLMAFVYKKDVHDCLHELEENTKIHLHNDLKKRQ